MTLEQVVQSELGDEFIEVAERLGREPAEVLAAVLTDFIVTVHKTPRQTNPAAMPPSQKEALASMLGLWADRPDPAPALREANQRVT